MKIKVITTSSSGLNYLPHAQSIAIVPDIIYFTEYEQYNDFEEITPESLYARMRLDSTCNPKIMPQKIDCFGSVMDKALNEGYEVLFFVLPTVEIINYKPVIELLTRNIDIPYYIFYSNTIGYSLAYQVVELDRMLKNGDKPEDAIKMLDSLVDRCGMVIHSPGNDLLPFVSRIEYDEDVFNYDMKAKVYDASHGALTKIKVSRKKSPLSCMLKHYYNINKSDNVNLAIFFTSDLSKYNEFIEEKLLSIHSGLNNIKKLPLPSAVGIKAGCNSVAVAYIKK